MAATGFMLQTWKLRLRLESLDWLRSTNVPLTEQRAGLCLSFFLLSHSKKDHSYNNN